MRETEPQPLDQTLVTAGAAAIIDVWMGGDQSWRTRMDDSGFLGSADWMTAVELATAVLKAVRPAAQTPAT